MDLDSALLEDARVALRVRRHPEAAECHLPASTLQHLDQMQDAQQTALPVELRQPRGDHQGAPGLHRSPFPSATTRASGW